jgi:hypothetical protein
MKNNRSFFLIGKEILKGFGKVVEMERVSLRGFFRGFFWKFFFWVENFWNSGMAV